MKRFSNGHVYKAVNGSEMAGGGGGGGGGGGQQFRDIEEQNDQMTEELRDRIGLLKNVAIDINSEIQMHNRLLNDLDSDMMQSHGFLGATMAKISQLRNGRHNYYVCYLFLFAIFVFFVLYVFVKFF